ncbi:macrophage migration inhibitory factor homolog [Babylonia areolata]|uniref:macrophage migration inhibitory factor homolog n=1 Tax=Babylonia areolata TaxID=304850 RepID=UPI003FD39576
MPIITVTTNVPGSVIPVFFQAGLTQIMHQALQKPKQVMMVDLREGSNIMMGGDRNPCVYATVECIGRLNPRANQDMVTAMEGFFMEHLKVRQERIIIRFIPVQAQFCSFNGVLHDVGIETDQDLLNTQE